jgi:hypothetical protein
MPRSASAATDRSPFEAFVFAPIGLQQNGMELSVLSALARLDVDPWREAASLAKMSMSAATARMRSLIASLPEATSPQWNADEIAARLVAFLPARPAVSGPMSSTAGRGVPDHYRAVLLLILMTLLLESRFAIRNPHAPAQAAGVSGTAPSTMSSPNVAPARSAD